MADIHPQTINLKDLESAVSTAVAQVKAQKLTGVPDLSREQLIIGKYLREAASLHAEATAGLNEAAEQITKQVLAKTPGLAATPIVRTGGGGILVGLILNERITQ